jgi:hypothetical protein
MGEQGHQRVKVGFTAEPGEGGLEPGRPGRPVMAYPTQYPQKVLQFEKGRDGKPAVQQVIRANLKSEHDSTLRL